MILLPVFSLPPGSPMPLPPPALPLRPLLPGVRGGALGDGGCPGQCHEAALHLLHEEGGGGGHYGGGMVLQAGGR